jgi:hypothetical protein
VDRAKGYLVRAWTLGAVFAVLLAAVLGPVSAAYANPLLPGTVTGRVVNASDVGIGGVTVRVSGVTTVTVGAGTNWFDTSAVTDPDGDFIIADLVEGMYSMWVNEWNADLTFVTEYADAAPWSEYAFGGDTRRYVTGGATETVEVELGAAGMVSGRAMNGDDPVAGAYVSAKIFDALTEQEYSRSITTDENGYFTIYSAPAGAWTLKYSACGKNMPLDAVPDIYATGGDLAESAPVTFDLAPGEEMEPLSLAYRDGQAITFTVTERFEGVDYRLSNMWVTVSTIADDYVAYSMRTDDYGYVQAYLPEGAYHVKIEDGALGLDGLEPVPLYPTVTWTEDLVVESGQATQAFNQAMLPVDPAVRANRAIFGTIKDKATNATEQALVAVTLKDPATPYADPYRQVRSNSVKDGGGYLLRVPNTTGFKDSKIDIIAVDYVRPYTHETYKYTFTKPATTTTRTPFSIKHVAGGAISGTVRDELGTPVPGVMVSAWRWAYDSLIWGKVTWTSDSGGPYSTWNAYTDADGHYTIGGLPPNTDWKVTFVNYMDPAGPYKDYNRYYFRTYKNLPLAEPLDPPKTVAHTPVHVDVGKTTSKIDETITPGGYVALHADGPLGPTGSVWCDVMFKVGSTWVEVDSGYTTGGTFEKIRKVLPVGTYKVVYKDFFKRGEGTWEFALAEGETKFTSIIVPMPTSSEGTAAASFVGTIDGGLEGGGTGEVSISIEPTVALTATSGVLPKNLKLYVDSRFDFQLFAADPVSGVWALTLPYDPSIPDSVVGNIRVWHTKIDGKGELLTPIFWNTNTHTVMVQTKSLSPFQVCYSMVPVGLATPAASGSVKSNRTWTASGSVSPKHDAGKMSIQVKVYKYISRKWKLYKTFTAKNYDSGGGTRYKASVKLPRGTYRVYTYARGDDYHVTTTSRYRTIKVK